MLPSFPSLPLTHTHLAETDSTDTSFSVSNNAVIDSFKDREGNAASDLTDYAAQRDYFTITNATATQCFERPVRGNINERIPDLRAVVFDGKQTFNGQAVYAWNDHHGIVYLTTADAFECVGGGTRRRSAARAPPASHALARPLPDLRLCPPGPAHPPQVPRRLHGRQPGLRGGVLQLQGGDLVARGNVHQALQLQVSTPGPAWPRPSGVGEPPRCPPSPLRGPADTHGPPRPTPAHPARSKKQQNTNRMS